MRERETGKRYSVVGAARSDRNVVRGPKDRGFNPAERPDLAHAPNCTYRHGHGAPCDCNKDATPAHLTVCSYCGSVNEIVNQCGCDPNNLPTTIK
jgi:hypothetical protein